VAYQQLEPQIGIEPGKGEGACAALATVREPNDTVIYYASTVSSLAPLAGLDTFRSGSHRLALCLRHNQLIH
jgi:hypothetical protein